MSDETTVIAEFSKPKRKYTEPTKADYIIRCMAAENTVRAQDAELRQERAHAFTLHAQLQDALKQAENLRRLANGASVLAVIVIVLAFILIGGAR
jgi:hypothetical protein